MRDELLREGFAQELYITSSVSGIYIFRVYGDNESGTTLLKDEVKFPESFDNEGSPVSVAKQQDALTSRKSWTRQRGGRLSFTSQTFFFKD